MSTRKATTSRDRPSHPAFSSNRPTSRSDRSLALIQACTAMISRTMRPTARCSFRILSTVSWETHTPQASVADSRVGNDHKFVDAPGFSSPDDFLEHLNNALDVLLAEGKKGKPKMMTVALHPHIIGRPGRFVALKQFLQRVKAEQDDIWVCQKQDIAK